MVVEAYGRAMELPPNGYAGWPRDGSVEIFSRDKDGYRGDYAATPEYLYGDGRGKFLRFDKAAGDGIGLCRILTDGKYEIILYEDAETGFAIGPATAIALDKHGNEIGSAAVRIARGLTYVVPVEGAFSYLLSPAAATEAELTCERDELVAGEVVMVIGKKHHQVQIPADAQPGDRIWRKLEETWIDFTVLPLSRARLSLVNNSLPLLY